MTAIFTNNIATQTSLAQVAEAVEYTDCISTEVRPHHECPRYDIKHSDSESP